MDQGSRLATGQFTSELDIQLLVPSDEAGVLGRGELKCQISTKTALRVAARNALASLENGSHNRHQSL